MKSVLVCLFTAFLVTGFWSCKKELSYEQSKDKAAGSLQSDLTGECLPKNVNGAFVEARALTSNEFIEVDIDVSTTGSYKISTDTLNGYYFSATGNFTSTGTNTVRLQGRGTPITAGADLFTIVFDTTFCVVAVTVLPASAGTSAVFSLLTSGTDCMDFEVNGTYQKGTALNSSNKVDIEVDVTTIGLYTITSTATNGMTFSSSGAFSTTGPQTVTLSGSGTPNNEGSITIPVTAGSSSCSFKVDVTAGGTPPVTPPTSTYFWKFTSGGFTYQGDVEDDEAELMVTSLPVIGNVASFAISSSTATGDTTILLTLLDFNGAIAANETYSSSSLTGNNAVLSVDDDSGTLFLADPTTTGATLTVRVTSHNTTTRVIEGTFTGTTKNGAGIVKTITNGQFKAQYP